MRADYLTHRVKTPVKMPAENPYDVRHSSRAQVRGISLSGILRWRIANRASAPAV